MRSLTLSARRSCVVAGLDINTAWAVTIGAGDTLNLYGVRATQEQAKRLSQRVKRLGSPSRVVPAREL